MPTTGLGQAQESIPRELQAVEPHSQAGQGKAADITPALTPTDCPVCGDAEAEPIAVCSDSERPDAGDAFLALRCSECGSVYVSPAPANGASFPSIGLSVPASLSQPAQRVRSGARGLDPAQVISLSPESEATIDAGSLGREHYHLVILDGTLEYSPAPLALLTSLRESLRPSGQVVLVLKNLASPSFGYFGGRHWAGYDFPRQRAVYSIEGIRRLAGRSGLQIRSVSSASNPGCWVESCRRALSDWQVPGWVVSRFMNTSLLSRAIFGVFEGVLRWRGKGALLVVSLERAGEE
jgi:hypothetical protein